MNAIGNRIRDHASIQGGKIFRIEKVGMVPRMVSKDFVEIKKLFGSVTFKPASVEFFIKRIDFFPDIMFQILTLF